jgi:hypothetical protein
MKRCSIHVVRHYGRPGQCEKVKNVKPVVYRDARILACTVHRQLIARGAAIQKAAR